jgi:hypothetical protein
MKHAVTFLTTIFIAFTFRNCNNVKQHDIPGPAREQSGKDAYLSPIPAGDTAKYITRRLEVKGEVEFPLVLTVDSLKQMKTDTVGKYKVACQSGAAMAEGKICKGVLLRDILEKAKIKQANHKDRNFYIVARASDNYKATFSWAEIFNNPTGENTYVIYEENGMPVKGKGEMVLICTNDIKTGPRHVNWLKSIEVHRVK